MYTKNNKKSDDAKSWVEDRQMNPSYKRPSMEDHYAGKKAKVIWTKGLSKKFLKAIGKLGIDNASPKKILELMNVDGLTRDNVASHLQKYRISLNKINSTSNGVQTASKQYLSESSMVKATSLKNPVNRKLVKWPSYSRMHTTNPPLLDNPSSCFPFLEDANFSAVSSALTHSVSAHEEGILDGFENEDEFFLAKSAMPDGVRNVSHYAYQDNKKSNDAKSCGEENEMNWSSKSASMKDHCAGMKKSKIIWTKGLKEKFLEAIGKLGVDNASPKKILRLMKVDGLTRDHVASFLQKYRIFLKKIDNTSYGVQAASKPYLLETSMVNQDQMNSPSYSGIHTTNPPLVGASSSCFPFFEAANFKATVSSSLTHSGYSMQTMTNNLDEQRNLSNDITECNGDMENVIAEDDLVLTETDIASLFSYNYDNGDN